MTILSRVGAVVCALVVLASASGCGDEGLFPTTVDPGPDFSIADLLFDDLLATSCHSFTETRNPASSLSFRNSERLSNGMQHGARARQLGGGREGTTIIAGSAGRHVTRTAVIPTDRRGQTR